MIKILAISILLQLPTITSATEPNDSESIHPALIVTESLIFPALPNCLSNYMPPAIVQIGIDLFGIAALSNLGYTNNIYYKRKYMTVGFSTILGNRLVSIPYNLYISNKKAKSPEGDLKKTTAYYLAGVAVATFGFMFLANLN